MPIPLGVLAVAGAGAAGGGGSFDLLETTLISTTTSTVTFSNLNNYSDYKHLQIRAVVRGTTASLGNDILIRLNSNTGSNYAYHELTGDGSSVSSSGASSQTFMYVPTIGGNATANIFGSLVCDILDFSNANKNTTIRVLSGYTDPFPFRGIRLSSGFWNNTAAVTSISLLPQGNFAANSRISLYGIK